MRPAPCRTRWLKLGRDLRAEWGRAVLMLAAVAVSLAALGAVLGGYAVLARAMEENYLGTRPAAATLELPGGVDQAALAAARTLPEIAAAEAREVVLARTRVGGEWRSLLLFVVDDFEAMQLNRFTPEAGRWPPAPGTLLIERTATGMLEAGIGGQLLVRTARGEGLLAVSGLVHDPGLAPAWQERSGYAYLTRETLATLGEPPVLHELRIALGDPQADAGRIEAVSRALADRLEQAGSPVHEIRVPPPRQHPHQRQMTTMLFLMLCFSAMALLLSSVLVANALAAMLARQVREIGVMKAVGARAAQVVGIYAVLVAGLGAGAALVAIPLALAGAHLLAGAVAGLLNLTLGPDGVPLWVGGVQLLAGVAVPLLAAALPIGRAGRLSVRECLDRHGAGSDGLRPYLARLPRPLRDALRRPARLALTLLLLATGGAMFMTALNVSASWERTIAKVYETRHYDVEVRFHQPQPRALARRLAEIEGLTAVEGWGYSPAAFATPGQIDVVRVYPDKAHAALSVLAPPADTRMVAFPVLAGRWLLPGDEQAVVLNHAAAAQVPHARIGDPVHLSLDGTPTVWRLAGIVEEIGAAGVAYVSHRAFARVAGGGGDRVFRIAAHAGTPERRLALIREIEERLAAGRVGVETAMPLAELRTAMADHILILIRALVAMAAVLATVGGLGLSSAMGVGVLERTREFAVMKSCGATPGRIGRRVIAEALTVALLSFGVAVLLGLPLTLLLDTLVGRLGFVAPLEFIFAPGPAAQWLALVCLLSFLATLIPARRASGLTIAAGLAGV